MVMFNAVKASDIHTLNSVGGYANKDNYFASFIRENDRLSHGFLNRLSD